MISHRTSIDGGEPLQQLTLTVAQRIWGEGHIEVPIP